VFAPIGHNIGRIGVAFAIDMNNRPSVALYGFRRGAGGISHVMLNLMNALVDEGVHVDLLLNHARIPELANVRKEINIVRLGETDGFMRIPALSDYLRKRQPTVLLTNREPAVRSAALALRFSGASTRMAIRVGTAVSIALRRRHFFKRWLRQTAMVYCYRRAGLIIANSYGVAEDVSTITKIPLGKIHIINNPTVSDDILAEAEEPIDHPWFAPGSPPVILGVGRLARQKDFATLIRAFAKVRAQRDCRLVILGEGKERHNLIILADELHVAQHVDLPGHVSNPFAYMKRAAQFVLSSAWEGSPNVLIQALALGLPVVATDCRSGPREILANGRYGPLAPVGDAEALCREMLHTLDNPLEKPFLQAAAEPFRVDTCTRAYMKAMDIAGELEL
jgi:glycosyltransferase involved in cell wall biosynthesis